MFRIMAPIKYSEIIKIDEVYVYIFTQLPHTLRGIINYAFNKDI